MLGLRRVVLGSSYIFSVCETARRVSTRSYCTPPYRLDFNHPEVELQGVLKPLPRSVEFGFALAHCYWHWSWRGHIELPAVGKHRNLATLISHHGPNPGPLLLRTPAAGVGTRLAPDLVRAGAIYSEGHGVLAAAAATRLNEYVCASQ